jgi:hypothetical protein
MVLKLTDAEVTEIRSRYEAGGIRQKELAVEYGVKQSTISLLVSRKLHTAPRQGPALRGRVDAQGRECSTCRCYKLWSEYYLNQRSPTGHMASCKECRNARNQELKVTPFVPVAGSHASVGPDSGANVRVLVSPDQAERNRRDLYLQYAHGISIEQYEWMAEQQGHKCLICLEPETVSRHDSTGRQRDCLSVDHDHSCARHNSRRACVNCIRGLLCDACNRLIGFVEGRGAVVVVRFSDYLGRRPLLMEGGGAE